MSETQSVKGLTYKETIDNVLLRCLCLRQGLKKAWRFLPFIANFCECVSDTFWQGKSECGFVYV